MSLTGDIGSLEAASSHLDGRSLAAVHRPDDEENNDGQYERLHELRGKCLGIREEGVGPAVQEAVPGEDGEEQEGDDSRATEITREGRRSFYARHLNVISLFESQEKSELQKRSSPVSEKKETVVCIKSLWDMLKDGEEDACQMGNGELKIS